MLAKLREYSKYIIPFVLGVFLFALITNFDGTMQFLSGLWGGAWFVMSRVLGGFGLAYILNLFVNFLKKRLRFPVWLAIAFSYLVLIGTVVWVVLYIIPYMVRSIEQLIATAPGVVGGALDFISGSFSRLDELGLSMISTFINNGAEQLILWAGSLLDIQLIIPWMSAFGRSLITLLFWLIISVYALIDKDRILLYCKRAMRAFMNPDKVESRIGFCRDANHIFSKYVSGKMLESVIIGLLSLILYSIFRLELTPFLAFLAFLFNMIPFFGPIIGGAVSVLILLIVAPPLQALFCLIICVGLQTLDGSVIGPRILGGAVGISPLLTIIAISIGGDLAGLLGIFLSVPVFATFKILVIDRAVASRLERREALTAAPPEGESPP